MAPATKRAPGRRAPLNTEPVPVDAAVETWRNTLAGKVVVNRIGEYGRMVASVVHGGRTFQITPQERRMNQSGIATPEQDPFTNGTLAPVELVDGEPDTEALRANPNALSEEDLPKLFQLKGAEFVERIAQITNHAPLARLVELARDPRYDATLSQYEALKTAESELRATRDDRDRPTAPVNADGLPKGVTPR